MDTIFRIHTASSVLFSGTLCQRFRKKAILLNYILARTHKKGRQIAEEIDFSSPCPHLRVSAIFVFSHIHFIYVYIYLLKHILYTYIYIIHAYTILIIKIWLPLCVALFQLSFYAYSRAIFNIKFAYEMLCIEFSRKLQTKNWFPTIATALM